MDLLLTTRSITLLSGTSSTNLLFDKGTWNQHDAIQAGLPRSKIIVEGWNHGFMSLVTCQNPTIWKFMECIQKEQALTDLKIAQILTRKPYKRAPRWVSFDEELQSIVDSYDDYDSPLDYLTVVMLAAGF